MATHLILEAAGEGGMALEFSNFISAFTKAPVEGVSACAQRQLREIGR